MNLTKKSVSVLKSLQLPNGGILATPKDGAYPYVYTRDGVIMTKALNRAGEFKRSEKFYYFIKKFSKIEKKGELMHRYTPAGKFATSRMHQHDNMALFVHGVWDCYKFGKRKKFLEDMWSVVLICLEETLKLMKNGLVVTNSSVHENDVLESGFDLWVNSAACRAFYDGVEISRILGMDEGKKWKVEGDKLRKNIASKMFDKEKGVFRKKLKRSNAPDLSQLAPFYFDIINDKKILNKTLKHLRSTIWDEELGGFRRFEKYRVVKDWHWYTGGSGMWLVMTLWGARFYKRLGDSKGYKECMAFVDEAAKRNGGLLPEHVAPIEAYELWKKNESEYNARIKNEVKLVEKRLKKEKVVDWAVPLGWSHAEYLLLEKEIGR